MKHVGPSPSPTPRTADGESLGGVSGYGPRWAHGRGPFAHVTPGLAGPSTEESASGTKWYIGPNGSDSNAGTEASPCLTFEPFTEGGPLEATSGDVIVVKDGTLTWPDGQGRIVPTDGNITFCGEQGTRPTIDVSAWTTSDTVATFYGKDNITVRGFNVIGPADTNTEQAFEFQSTNDAVNAVPGSVSAAKDGGWVYNMYIEGMGGAGAGWYGTSCGGVVEHTVSHGNVGGDGNADGVQWTSSTSDPRPVLGGYCIDSILSHNADDGIDLYRARGHKSIRVMAAWNGYRPDGSLTNVDAPGKGIKLGGSDSGMDIGGNMARQFVTWGNGAAGCGANSANLEVDMIHGVAFNNARKDGTESPYNRSYENDYELFEGDGPSGYNLADSRIINCIGQQDLYTSLNSGSIDSTNVQGCNFDYQSNFNPTFAVIDWANLARDANGYPDDHNAFGRLDARASQTATGLGVTGYHPTPASSFHGDTTEPSFVGTSPAAGFVP